MSFLRQTEDQARTALTRKMPGISATEVEDWLAVEPRAWVLAHGPTLRAGGLCAQDAADLHRRLGPSVAGSLSVLINQGRMGDVDLRYVHLWAASGLLKPEIVPSGRPGRSGAPNFTRWVSNARRFIVACGGDQHLAALAAAAGLSVEETQSLRLGGELTVESLEMLAALRQVPHEAP